MKRGHTVNANAIGDKLQPIKLRNKNLALGLGEFAQKSLLVVKCCYTKKDFGNLAMRKERFVIRDPRNIKFEAKFKEVDDSLRALVAYDLNTDNKDNSFNTYIQVLQAIAAVRNILTHHLEWKPYLNEFNNTLH